MMYLPRIVIRAMRVMEKKSPVLLRCGGVMRERRRATQKKSLFIESGGDGIRVTAERRGAVEGCGGVGNQQGAATADGGGGAGEGEAGVGGWEWWQ